MDETEILEEGIEQDNHKEQVEEGISCKLDNFTKYISSPDPTLILFLGKKAEGADEITNTLFSRQDELDVNAGVLDLADDDCEDLSEKYKIDRDETQLMLFQNSEKKGAVSLSPENAAEQLDKIKEIITSLKGIGITSS